MRILISTTAIIFCFQFFIHADQGIPVKTQKLKKITPSTSYFDGKVTPVKTGKFGTLISGKIIYTASPGDMVISQILNAKGDIIRQGTPIIILDKTLHKLAVETARIRLQKDQVKIKNIKQLYNRYANLNSRKQKLISQTKVEQVKTDYDTAVLNVKTSEFELKKAEENLRQCTVYPRYTGQVDEVYYSPGTALDDFNDVLKITMMNPISVTIKLPLALVNKIGIENEIKVFNVGNKKTNKEV